MSENLDPILANAPSFETVEAGDETWIGKKQTNNQTNLAVVEQFGLVQAEAKGEMNRSSPSRTRSKRPVGEGGKHEHGSGRTRQ